MKREANQNRQISYSAIVIFSRCLFLTLIALTTLKSNGWCINVGNDSIQSHASLLSAHNHILIRGEINGKKAYFLLDTGASYSVLHSKLAKYYDFQLFQLPSGSRKSAGVNSSSTSQRLTAIDVLLNLGQPHTVKQAYFAENLTPVVSHIYRSSGKRIAGIIGTDLLKRLECSVDLGKNEIQFKPVVIP